MENVFSGGGRNGSDYRRELAGSLCGHGRALCSRLRSWTCTCNTSAQNHTHTLHPHQVSDSVLWAVTTEGDHAKGRGFSGLSATSSVSTLIPKIKCLWEATALRILKAHCILHGLPWWLRRLRGRPGNQKDHLAELQSFPCSWRPNCCMRL